MSPAYAGFDDFEIIFADFESRPADLFGRFAHPGRYRLSHALLESKAKGAVASVTAVAGQLLGNDGLLGSDSFTIETHEVVDTEVVNISIVSRTITGEILAEIGAVGTNCLGQLGKCQVVL